LAKMPSLLSAKSRRGPIVNKEHFSILPLNYPLRKRGKEGLFSIVI